MNWKENIMKKSFAAKEEQRTKEINLLREEIVSKCSRKDEKGTITRCSNIEQKNGSVFCKTWLKPSEKWRLGDCHSADLHLRTNFKEEKKRVRVGQQKTKRKNR